MAVAASLTGCNAGGHQSGLVIATTRPPTSTAATLGKVSAGCQGCGEVEPTSVTLQGYEGGGVIFGGVVFSQASWQSWGMSQAKAPGTQALFAGAPNSTTLMLVAFDLGRCGSTFGYTALEWLAEGQIFEPWSYFDTCTGRGVGPGWPPGTHFTPTTTASSIPGTNSEFYSPSENIACEIDYYPGTTRQMVSCTSMSPAQSVTLSPEGIFKTCFGGQCLSNIGARTPMLAYGDSVDVGPFQCTSTVGGVVCTAEGGRGFKISTAGITAVGGG